MKQQRSGRITASLPALLADFHLHFPFTFNICPAAEEELGGNLDI